MDWKKKKIKTLNNLKTNFHAKILRPKKKEQKISDTHYGS